MSGLSAETISALGEREVRANWLRVFDVLEVEPPASVLHMTCFGQCSVGAFSYSNHNCEIFDSDIGRYCSIGQNVILNPGHHPTGFLTSHPVATSADGHPAAMQGFETFARFALTAATRPVRTEGHARVRLGHDVWLGANVVVTQGVSIGTGAIVGTGAVVTRNIEPYAIVAGVPARPIRLRLPKPLIDRLLASEWWRYDLSVMPERDYSDPERMIGQIEAFQARSELPLYAPAPIIIRA